MAYETLTETEWERVNRIWDLLEDGELERARLELDDMMRKRPGHPDLKIVDASIAIDEGEPEHALDTLRGAERSADPALFFHLRALAQFQLAKFEEARDDAERALAIRAEMPEAHDLMSRALEHLGAEEDARRHAEEATGLDPETFPPPLAVGDEEFDTLVESSLEQLPPRVRKHLEEIPVLVQPLPDRAVLTAETPPLTPDLLGLFVGRDLMTSRNDDPPSSPGAIFLFRRNLLRACRDREELAREVRITVQHEVGHLLGLNEDELESWGLG
ncbi:MAG TPA: metallopeptidase family protein [Candidatus Eisenbacteria bacterium]|jgi:predicted Zn-dependent protease with MMP-like domain